MHAVRLEMANSTKTSMSLSETRIAVNKLTLAPTSIFSKPLELNSQNAAPTFKTSAAGGDGDIRLTGASHDNRPAIIRRKFSSTLSERNE